MRDVIQVRQLPLRELANGSPNSFIDGPFGSNLKSDEYVDAGVRLIQLQNIGVDSWLDDNKRYITHAKFSSLSRHGAQPGDIAIAKMADPVARACLVPPTDNQFLVVADCIRLRIDATRFDSRFVVAALNSNNFRRSAEAASIGSTRVRINLSVLKNLRIPAPPLEEQKKIADVLDSMDESISSTERLIVKLIRVRDQSVEALLDSYLNRDRAPLPDSSDRSGRQLVRERLGSLTRVNVGYVGPISDHFVGENSGVPLLSTRSIADERIVAWDGRRVSRGFDSANPKSRLSAGDLIVARHGESGSAAVVPHDLSGAQCLNVVIVRRCRELVPDFLALLLTSRAVARSISATKAGSVQGVVNTSEMERLVIPVPGMAEQRKVLKVTATYGERVKAEAAYLEKLKTMRKGLIEDLLTGRACARTGEAAAA